MVDAIQVCSGKMSGTASCQNRLLTSLPCSNGATPCRQDATDSYCCTRDAHFAPVPVHRREAQAAVGSVSLSAEMAVEEGSQEDACSSHRLVQTLNGESMV